MTPSRIPPTASRPPWPPARSILLLAALFFAGCELPSPDPTAGPFDLIILNGKVVDGTGAPWFYGDVGFRGDRIAAVTPAGLLAEADAGERVDAAGLVVAPGFVDLLSHSRGALLTGDGRLVSKVTQGITTEIVGEGTTNAPMNERTLEALTFSSPEEEELHRSFMGARGFGRWLEAMEENGISVNVGAYVGATTVRIFGKGQAMGPAGPAELDSMRTAVRWAMEEGAFGLSTSLIYPPGIYASTEELIQLARVAGEYGGHYVTHMRSEADLLLEATDEAIRIGAEGGVPVEIYHLKAAGVRNHAKGPALIAKIDSARAAGLDVQANMYPYVAGGTGLTACLPPWSAEDGLLYRNLEDPEIRARIRAEVLDTGPKEWENLCQQAGMEGVLLLGFNREENLPLAGRTLASIAAERGQLWVDTAMDLLISEGQRIGTIYFLMSEENVRMKMQQPWMKFGSDAGGMDPDSVSGGVHPRAYGTFPRILGRYVREEGVISLEEAIRKASSAAAVRMGIVDRGVLRPGMFADVVIFDAETIMDRATFEEPHQLSEGVRHVFVNGTAVVRDGVHTGAFPGRALRGPGYGVRR